jgi:lysophospholipase L1-like esterase
MIRRFAASAALVLASIILSCLFGELLLRVALEPADVLQISLIKDPILGYRIPPYTPGHDSLGFRNARLPEQSDIVAVGDSQTYGVSAVREDSWPAQLGRRLGRSVYNMAVGGYGPLEYLYLINHETARLHPKEIVVGFYFGNDLMDACVAVEHRQYWSRWRTAAGPEICTEPPDAPRRFGALRDWLARHSVTYGVAKAALLAPVITRLKEREAKHGSPDEEMPWVDPANAAVQTIFTPQLRFAALDPKQPGVQEGMRGTERAFGEMREATNAQGARLLVALIPTKEAVYCDPVQHSGVALPPIYARLCTAEAQLARELSRYLAAAGIRYIDLAKPLQDAAATHRPLYPSDDNGHPIAAGYAVIAKAVYDKLTGD